MNTCAKTAVACAACLLALTLSMPAGEASVVAIPGAGGGIRLNNIHVKTLVDMRFKQIVRQQYDVSCGAAAVATLLKHYFGREQATEEDVLRSMIKIGDQEKIQRFGFSLLEMKKYTEMLGYTSRGFRLKNIDVLTRLKVPVITLTNVRGYAHFVVVKGVRGNRAYIADPAFGNRAVPLDEFEASWNQVILIVIGNSVTADNTFELQDAVKTENSTLASILSRVSFIHTTVTPGVGEF
ncbi:MAG: C39 family peptidase [Candidatus Tectomicrobia bacterium]|uniref:C39 family peptidase n=1 Tax=Tectimicrobiota bacterium TaxID=2528274 RepID=A0A932MPH4_UNCTE|nr:C39 family peptidase [Candidatus Tectomicrobia bacterium]